MSVRDRSNSAPAYGADVPNGTDIHDVAQAVMEMIVDRRPGFIPKHMRQRFLDADGNTVAEIAARVLRKRYPPEGTR